MRHVTLFLALATLACGESSTEPEPPSYPDIGGIWSQSQSGVDRSVPVEIEISQGAGGELSGCGRSLTTTPEYEEGPLVGRILPDSSVSLTVTTSEDHSEFVWNGEEEVEVDWTETHIWEISAEVIGNLVSGSASETEIFDYVDPSSGMAVSDTALVYDAWPIGYRRETTATGAICP